MTTPVVIRQAQPHDAFAVAALHLQYGREAGRGPESAFLDRWADAWLADREARPYWLAEVESRPLGVVGLHVVTDLPQPGQACPPRWAHGEFLYVTPQFRRCGIGGRLVREANAWARAEALTQVVADLAALGAAADGIGRCLAATASRHLLVAPLHRPA